MGSCLSTSHNASFFANARSLWQDRQIRWDQPRSALTLANGEIVAHTWDNIEDTKGDNRLGALTLSNLRLMWTSNDSLKLNISIGLGNIAYVHYNMVDSVTFGRVRASHLMTQSGTSRFEFTFASRDEAALGLFTELDNALRRYRATRVFRELILREENLLTADGESAAVYYGEQLVLTGSDCENLTSDEKFPGIFFVTDKRIIWSARHTPLVNVSIPFIQIQAVGTRTSAFGPALVIETSAATGGYVLGFRFPTPKVLWEIRDVLQKLHGGLRANPFYGPLDGTVHYFDDRLVVLPDNHMDGNSSQYRGGLDGSPEGSGTTAGLPTSDRESQTTTTEDHCIGTTTTSPASLPTTSCSVAHPGPTEGDPNHLDRQQALSAFTPTSLYPSLVSPSGASPPRRLTDASLQSSLDESLGRSPGRQSDGQLMFGSSAAAANVSPTSRRFALRRRAMENILRRSVMSPVAKEPINLNSVNPLPLGVQSGQASVCFSSSSRAALTQTEMLLAMSPSSKKYRAPRCVVCMATMTEAAFDPCGHLCSCMKCASKMKHCPICRGGVQKVLRIYMQAA